MLAAAAYRDALNRLAYIAEVTDPESDRFLNDSTRRGTEHATELTRAIRQAKETLADYRRD